MKKYISHLIVGMVVLINCIYFIALGLKKEPQLRLGDPVKVNGTILDGCTGEITNFYKKGEIYVVELNNCPNKKGNFIIKGYVSRNELEKLEE